MKEWKMMQKVMFKLLPVQVLLASVGNINGIVSSLFAGNFVGVKAMTAVGLYVPYNLAIVAVTAMLVGGATIVCGEHLGRNDQAGIQNTFALDMMLTGIISLIVTAAHLIFGLVGSITRVSDDPDISRMLILYVIGQAIGVIPLMLGSQLSAFLSLDNKGKRTTLASFLYIIVNFLLNYLFVGVMGLQAMGLALAPSIGLWVYFLVQAPYFLKAASPMHFAIKGIDWHESARILKIGVPGAIGNVYNAIRGVIVNSLILTYVGVVVFSALLIGKMGITGVYTANVLNGFIAPVFILIYSCIYNKRFPRKVDELMSVPAEFGVPVYGRIDIVLHDMDQVIGLSNTLQEFCEERGIDKRRAFYASLFLEEIAGNVVEHGFSADNKKHSVQVRIAVRPETLILSIKDDCVPFNIEQRRQMMDQEDVTKNIGIRLVSGIASEMHYQNILGLNVLSLRLNGNVIGVN